MKQKMIVEVGDVIEIEGKNYRAEAGIVYNCNGCVFDDYYKCPFEGDCITNSVIFKEVKETPRHLELAVIRAEDNWVIFKIVEQTHRGKNFSQQTAADTFKASNGIKLGIRNFPEWSSDSSQLFCRGFSSDKDNIEIVCTTSEFARISEAVNEYNITDGKGYEKPWPQKGDEYFYILDNGAIYSRIFDGDKYDCDMQDYGNLFRTEEEAIEARDKVKVLLNGL